MAITSTSKETRLLVSSPGASSSSSSSPTFPIGTSFGPKIDTVLDIRKEIDSAQRAGDARFEDADSPDAFGLLPKDVFDFLTQKNSDFFRWWTQLKQYYANLPADTFLNSYTVKQLCEEGQQAIRAAFRESWQTPWDRSLSDWVASYPEGTVFAVRSSAIKGEDGKISNAGGNLTVSYVPKEEILTRCGEVIASYYQLSSIANILRGNGNPFELLELSVGIQPQIGEIMGGEPLAEDIPISGVLLTNEPLYVRNEHYRLMRITTTWGHGEAVVGNQGIPCDTYLVLQSRRDPRGIYIVEDISAKTHRLAPQDGELKLMLNPDALIQRPTLDPDMVQKIYHLALALETEGAPSDMEFVIKRREGRPVIHIVQKRPVNRKPPLPSRYIDLSQTTAPKVEKLIARIPGHLSTIEVTDFSRILFCDFLEEALDLFNPTQFDLVVIKYDERPNSHPVMNFSEWGVPVFVSIQTIEAPSEGEITVFCPQQGIMVQGPSTRIALKAGEIEHPAPLHFGGIEKIPHLPSKPGTLETITHLMQELTAERTDAVASSSMPSAPSLKPVKTAAGWHSFKIKAEQTQGFAAASRRLVEKVRAAGKELKSVISEHGGRLEQLFHAKVFRTLLTEGAFSVISMTQVLDETIEFEKEGGNPLLAQHLIVKTLHPEIKTLWKTFLLEISHQASSEQIKAFLHLLDALGDLKPLWMTFYVEPKRALSSLELLGALLTEFDETSMEFIRDLKHKPLQYFDDEATFMQRFEQVGKPTKVIALSYLAQAVGSYDDQLKALKTAKIPLNGRILNFKEKLNPYFNLMRHVAERLVGEGKFYFPPATAFEASGTLTIYLSIMSTRKDVIYSRPNAEDLLLPSANFNVATAKLGVGTNSSRELPGSLEDIFTLTHQNLLACIGFLYQENLPPLSIIALPPLVQDCVEQILTLGNETHPIQLTSVEQLDQELILGYTIPQRNHSSTCQVRFQDGKISFEVQMLGQARDRWAYSAGLIHMLNWAGLITTDEVRLRGNTLKLVFPIESKEQMTQACRYVQLIYSIALNEDTRDFTLTRAFRDRFDLIMDKIKQTSNPQILHGIVSVLIRQMSSDPRLLQVASYLHQHPDPRIQQSCVSIVRGLSYSPTRDSFETLCAIARTLMQSSDPTVQTEALRLISLLFPFNLNEAPSFITKFITEGKFASQVLSAAKEKFENTFEKKPLESAASLQVLEALADCEETREDAISLISQVTESIISKLTSHEPDSLLFSYLKSLQRYNQTAHVLKLIHTLLSKMTRVSSNTAPWLAETYFNESKASSLILNLLQEMSKDGQLSEALIPLLPTLYLSYETNVKTGCWDLALKLLLSQVPSSQVATLVKELCSQSWTPSHESVFTLIDQWIEQGDLETAIDVLVSTTQKQVYPRFIAQAQKRFSTLIQRGHAYSEAIAFTQMCLTQDNLKFEKDKLTLLKDLLEKGERQLVLPLIKETAVNGAEYGARKDAFELINHLIEQDRDSLNELTPWLIALAMNPDAGYQASSSLRKLLEKTAPTPELIRALPILMGNKELFLSTQCFELLKKSIENEDTRPHALAIIPLMEQHFRENNKEANLYQLWTILLEHNPSTPLNIETIISMFKGTLLEKDAYEKIYAACSLIKELIKSGKDLSSLTTWLIETVQHPEHLNWRALNLCNELITSSEPTPEIMNAIPMLLKIEGNPLLKACLSVLQKAVEQQTLPPDFNHLIQSLFTQAIETNNHVDTLFFSSFILKNTLPVSQEIPPIFDTALKAFMEQAQEETIKDVTESKYVENKEEEIATRIKETFNNLTKLLVTPLLEGGKITLEQLPLYQSLSASYAAPSQGGMGASSSS